MTATGRATVLVVCRANLIRSPFAAGFLRSRLGAAGLEPHDVTSAGLQAAPGATPAPDTVAVAREWDVDLSRHSARPVGPADLDGAALVLTMTEAQRTAVTRLAPALTPRTFTLLELVRLLDGAGSTDWCPGELAATAHLRRPLVAGTPGAEDVADPVGRGYEHLSGTLSLLARSCEALLSGSGVVTP